LNQAPGEAAGDGLSPKVSLAFLFVGIILFTVALMVVSFPVGLYTVFGTRLSNNYSASSPVYALTYDLDFARVQVPLNSNLGDVFAIFLLIYFGFLLLAGRQGPGLFRALRAATTGRYEALFTNPLSAMTVLLGATSLVTILVDTVQSGAGVSTGSLTGDPFSLLVDFTVAPLLEESTFRLIMLGVPVLVLALLLLRGLSPLKAAKMLWRPSSAWDVDETDDREKRRSFDESDLSMFPSSPPRSLRVRALRPIVYVFLVLSSFSFGYAHYASGSGWGPGKVSEAALAGLALGYLYIKYGFHTSVLLHWSINYVGSIYSFLAQGLYGVPWTSNSGSFLDVLPSVDIVFLLGVPSLLLLVNELMKGAMGTSSKE
jgi:hypothetical protein